MKKQLDVKPDVIPFAVGEKKPKRFEITKVPGFYMVHWSFSTMGELQAYVRQFPHRPDMLVRDNKTGHYFKQGGCDCQRHCKGITYNYCAPMSEAEAKQFLKRQEKRFGKVKHENDGR